MHTNSVATWRNWPEFCSVPFKRLPKIWYLGLVTFLSNGLGFSSSMRFFLPACMLWLCCGCAKRLAAFPRKEEECHRIAVNYMEEAAKQLSWVRTRLSKTSWRIDVKTKSKSVTEMSEPSAIVELLLAKEVCIHWYILLSFKIVEASTLFTLITELPQRTPPIWGG